MKNSLAYYCWIALFWGLSQSLSAQLLVDNTTYTAKNLVENFLIGGGLQVSNVTLGGQTVIRQLGYFNNSNSNLGLNEGIMLSTGYADDAITTVNNTAYFTSFSPNCTNQGLCLGGDADLSNIVGENTFDAAVLEFDFIPTGDTIRFRYVFASEEYNDYTCSEFNDLFAFLLTGPGHNKTNIAQIPNSTIPVAINTVNNGSVGVNGSLGNCTTPNGSLAHSNLFIDNIGASHIEFNGMTVVLEAVAKVTPCATYHIKLAVADAVDHFIDSGVFLEANSFTTNAVDVVLEMPDDSTLVENCNDAIVSFRLFKPLNYDLPVTYSLGGSATNGLDYTILPLSAIIPAGSTQISFNITPLADAVSDPLETIELQVNVSPCSTATFLIYLREEAPLAAINAYCVYSNAVGIVIGWDSLPDALGYEISVDNGLTWQMANGVNLHVIGNLLPNMTVRFMVRGIGGYTKCLNNAITTINCSTINCNFSGQIVDLEQVDCYGNENGTITYEGRGGTPPYSYKLNNGLFNDDNQFTNLATGNYEITVIDSNFCSHTESFFIENPDSLSIGVGIDTSIIFGDSIQLNGTVLSTHDNVTYEWLPPSFLSCTTCPNPIAFPTESLNYSLVVTDENGCEAFASIGINVLRPRTFFMATAFTPNGDKANDQLYIQGGIDLLKVHSFEIYDRWGELVFKEGETPANDAEYGWDGTFKNEPMNPAVFTWITQVEYNDGAIVTYSGQVFLIR